MSSKKYGPRFLKEISTYRVPEGVTTSAVESFLSALDCPRALTVAILFRNGEHDQLSQLGFDPLHYNSVMECRDAYSATKFLSKYSELLLSADLDQVAFQKFDEFESLCKQSNYRFRFLERDPLYKGRVVWLHHAITRKISKILGDFDADEFFSTPDWGPGATTLIKRRDASSAKKFRCETGITRDLYDLIPNDLLVGMFPTWGRHLVSSGFYPNFQVGNKVITVPKDASTNRVIAIEPGINLWFQKSVGNMIQRRLLRCGIDLRYQSRNQELARLGSLTNQIATIDLSSASDSIARSVVEELLPPRWFHIMDACRSHYGNQSGRTLKWEKFSSMGNGFTFQLESLIFFAVAFCCTEYLNADLSCVSAYGDDVLLPSACFDLFREMLGFYGFRLNVKKSHFDSPFRESCGAHYFSGVDVKPIFLKERLSSVLTVYRFANAVRRLSHRRNLLLGCDDRFRPLFESLMSSVPEAFRLRIPDGLGDGGFIGNLDESTPSYAKHGIERYLVRNVSEVSKTYQDDTIGYLLASLWQLEKSSLEDSIPLARIFQVHQLFRSRGIVSGNSRTMLQANLNFGSGSSKSAGRNSVPLSGRTRLRVKVSLVQQWYDLGTWF